MSALIGFSRLPVELIQHICKAITEDDVDDRESLATLAKLARVCKGLSGVASLALRAHECVMGQPIELCYGLRTGNLDMVKIALENGCQPDQPIVLHRSVVINHDRPRCSQFRLKLQCRPLLIAAAAGSIHIVRYLVELGAKIDYFEDDILPSLKGVAQLRSDPAWRTAGRHNTTDWLREHHTEKKLRLDQRFKSKKRDLYVQPSETWPEMDFRWECSPDPEWETWTTEQPALRLALINRQEEVAAYLIERGAVLGHVELRCAAKYGCCKALELMPIDSLPPRLKTVLLMNAATSSHPVQVGAVLLRGGADPNSAVDPNAEARYRDCLFDELNPIYEDYHGCTQSTRRDQCAPDANTVTALGYACYIGAFDLAHLLLDHGADASKGQAWVWQQCLHNKRSRETSWLLQRMIQAGLDVHHLSIRCEYWYHSDYFDMKGSEKRDIWALDEDDGMHQHPYENWVLHYGHGDEDSDSNQGGGRHIPQLEESWELQLEECWELQLQLQGEDDYSDDDTPSNQKARNETIMRSASIGLPLFRNCMDDFGDAFHGFVQTGRLDIARTLLKNGASMAVPNPASTKGFLRGTRRREWPRVFPQHKDKEPTHHAPRCSLYDSLDTGSVLWFWALCRQQFDLCDLLREYGAPVPQTDDELKLTVLMAFNGRSQKTDKVPKYPHICRSEFPTRATFGDHMRWVFMSPHYRGNILEYLTKKVAPAESWLRNREVRDSWLKEYEFGFLIDEERD